MDLQQSVSYYALGFDGAEYHSIPVGDNDDSTRAPKRGQTTELSEEFLTPTPGTKRGKFQRQQQQPSIETWKDEVQGNMHYSAPAMESHVQQMLEAKAAKNWHKFYQRNQDKFYKDRHYLHHAFPGIIRQQFAAVVGGTTVTAQVASSSSATMSLSLIHI